MFLKMDAQRYLEDVPCTVDEMFTNMNFFP